MKKKRIRYSEFGATPEKSAESASPVEAAAPIELPEVPVAPRPRRNSTPVELARALAAAQLLEAANAAKEAEQEAAKDTSRPAPVPAPTKTDLAEVLVFRIGLERFAVDLLAVEEVIDLPVIHFVPEMPAAMVGVVNVRDSLTPVFTPNAALGLPVAPSEAVLIFRRAAGRVGVLIDDVEDAVTIDLRELRRAPDADDNVVLGVIRHDGNMFAIVDADALIAACQTAALLEIA
ncbi:MAG: CheW protein [Gemmatimonadetes bacterium]|nr:CheW protein [Gemmatimonadota bacterium]